MLVAVVELVVVGNGQVSAPSSSLWQAVDREILGLAVHPSPAL